MTNEEINALFFQRIQKAAEVLDITHDKLRQYLEDADIYTGRGGRVHLNSYSLTCKNLMDMLTELCNSKFRCLKAAYILKDISLVNLPEYAADLIFNDRLAPTTIKGMSVAPPVEKVPEPSLNTPDKVEETFEERLEEQSPETYELYRRIYKAVEIMGVTATKLLEVLSAAGIDASPEGTHLLDSDAITVQDLVDVIEVGHLSKTINVDGVLKEVPVPVLRVKAAAHALKARVPDFMESTKGEVGTLTISGPEPKTAHIKGEKECREDYLKNIMGSLSMFKPDIKQMKDKDLLELYIEDQSYETEQELHRRSHYNRFIVLGPDKKIDFEVSLDLLKRCRKMVIPTVIPVNGNIVPVYRITELNPEENLVELCPICGAVTYKGYCDKCQIDFGPVGDVERSYAYLVSKHANFNASSFSDRRALVASAMKGLEDLKSTWPSVIKNFEELQLTNSLPSLKKTRELPCVVKPSDPFNISK